MKDQVKKSYPFKFTPLMIVLFVLGILLCVAGFSITLWRFIRFVSGSTTTSEAIYGWIEYLLLFFVSVFLAVFLLSVLISSRYTITEKYLILRFGFIPQRYALSSVCSVHLFKGMNKLAVYFDDYRTKYTVIVVKDAWYEDFVKTLLAQKPTIGFSFSTPEEEEEFKKKK